MASPAVATVAWFGSETAIMPGPRPPVPGPELQVQLEVEHLLAGHARVGGSDTSAVLASVSAVSVVGHRRTAATRPGR